MMRKNETFFKLCLFSIKQQPTKIEIFELATKKRVFAAAICLSCAVTTGIHGGL